MSAQKNFYGAIEAGGTKFVCAIGDEMGNIHSQTRIPTRDPVSTLADVQGFLRAGSKVVGRIAAIGIGCFGPIDLDKPLHGLTHPEIGHIYPRRHLLDSGFPGVCPFHRDCLEGLASGPAILARTGSSLQQLDGAHPQWDIQADYLGQLCAQVVLTLSPQRIVMGGGVMTQLRLLPLVRQRLRHWLGGYINRREILADADRYVVAPALHSQAGILGALGLAMDAASSS